jgi:hypothetical protein
MEFGMPFFILDLSVAERGRRGLSWHVLAPGPVGLNDVERGGAFLLALALAVEVSSAAFGHNEAVALKHHQIFPGIVL